MTAQRDETRRHWPSALKPLLCLGHSLCPGRCLHSFALTIRTRTRSMVMRISARRSAVIARR